MMKIVHPKRTLKPCDGLIRPSWPLVKTSFAMLETGVNVPYITRDYL